MVFFWLIVGILLMIGEIYTPGFFLFSIALGSFASSITALITKSIFIQITVFVIAMTLSILLLRPMLNKYFAKEKRTNATRMIGMSVVVEERIPKGGKGRVKVNGESWLASSNENIEKDEIAIVEAIDGLTLKVKKA